MNLELGFCIWTMQWMVHMFNNVYVLHQVPLFQKRKEKVLFSKIWPFKQSNNMHLTGLGSVY